MAQIIRTLWTTDVVGGRWKAQIYSAPTKNAVQCKKLPLYGRVL